MSNKKLISKWEPNNKEKYVERDGKLLVCHFGKIFGEPEKLDEYSKFIIGKESYINRLDAIVKTINYFETFYDTDHELIAAFLKIKYCLDNKKMFDETNMDAYIDFLYEVMFNERIISKIDEFVNYNYKEDIETSDADKSKFMKNEKKHLESLEFTNKHVKILLAISTAMKFMAGPLFHYIQRNKIRLPKGTEILFNFYKRLFDIFGHGDNYDMYREGEEKPFKENCDAKTIEKYIKENNISPTKMNNGDIRYYTTDDENGVYYFKKSGINMYNKLYVYVNFGMAQTLKNLFNCWNVLLGY